MCSLVSSCVECSLLHRGRCRQWEVSVLCVCVNVHNQLQTCACYVPLCGVVCNGAVWCGVVVRCGVLCCGMLCSGVMCCGVV